MLLPTMVETDVRINLAPVDAAFGAFRQAYPAFDSTCKLDDLRATEYARLDRQGRWVLPGRTWQSVFGTKSN